MANLSPETIKKLRWLQKRVLKYPESYNQGRWCGTQGCLAGFCAAKVLKTVLPVAPAGDKLSYLKKRAGFEKYIGFEELGRKFLGIEESYAGSLLSDRLFSGYWDGRAEKFNRKPKDSYARAAQKAVKRIDMFIETDGAV